MGWVNSAAEGTSDGLQKASDWTFGISPADTRNRLEPNTGDPAVAKRLHYDSKTGLFVDPSTGIVYADQDAMHQYEPRPGTNDAVRIAATRAAFGAPTPAGAGANVDTPPQFGGNTAEAGNPALVQDPQTGLWLNPATGNVYADKNGQTQVKNPNVAQQVARNIAASGKYAGLGGEYDAALKGTMAEQKTLADAYRRTISDPNAPSVAHEQLNQALQAADASQLSMAAGASGENAFLARRTASDNMAGLAAKSAQDEALVRAQEVEAAQKGLGTTLGTLGTEASGQATHYSDLANNYATLAANGEAGGDANALAKRGQNIGIGTTIGQGVAAGLSGAISGAGKSSGGSSDSGVPNSTGDETGDGSTQDASGGSGVTV